MSHVPLWSSDASGFLQYSKGIRLSCNRNPKALMKGKKIAFQTKTKLILFLNGSRTVFRCLSSGFCITSASSLAHICLPFLPVQLRLFPGSHSSPLSHMASSDFTTYITHTALHCTWSSCIEAKDLKVSCCHLSAPALF